MDHTLQILLFLFLLHRPSLTSAAAAAFSPKIPSPAACFDDIIRLSSCLPFVALFPYNFTVYPPSQCCDNVSAAFGKGSAGCLCYFLHHQQKIYKFSINSTKLFSLDSVCPLKNQSSKSKISLQALCSGGESEESRGPSLSPLPAKIPAATGYINDNTPLVQQSPPSKDDLSSTSPDLLKRRPTPQKPPIIEPPLVIVQAPAGPSCNSSQSTNLGPLLLTNSLFMLLFIAV